MSVMRIQVARGATSFLRHRRDQYLHDGSIPLTVRGMINVHLEKSWIPGFWTVAIRAPKPGSENYFDFPIGTVEDETPWYFPSQEWWIAHAKASHPPDGVGCDVSVHTKFLSSQGDVHEFDYATILLDRTVKILGRSDFEEECLWWRRAFGAHAGRP